MMLAWPPVIFFAIAAIAALVLRGAWRGGVVLTILAFSLYNLTQLPAEMQWQAQIMGLELTPFAIDRLSLLFGYLFHIAAILGVIFSLHVKDTLQHVSGILYAGSAVGAVFCGDLLSLFVYWELLAVTSVFLIWARRTERARVAGMRYLIIQVLSGLLLLAGVVFYYQQFQTLEFTEIGLQGIYGWLIFLAFGIKCAFPLFHNWLTDAYPEATPTGTVFLSAFTTKVAIYAMARGYPGTELLVYIGATMACFPIFFAVIENDLRRVLGYSLINQLGFMIVGIGIGTSLAINGAVAHAFTDVIFKGLLFMSMGAVLLMTGRMNGSDLGGLYKSMPKTAILCMVGAASISAFPLFSGFVSKSMVMSAAIANGHDWVWLILLFASAGVFHHAGIKIPYFAFFAHDSGIRTTEPPGNMLIAMTIAAVLCITIGVFPNLLYQLLPFATDYSAYDATHVLAQMQLLFFSALAFVWLNLRGMYPPELPSVNLDVEWFYRRLFPRVVGSIAAVLWAVDGMLRRAGMGLIRGIGGLIVNPHSLNGFIARSWAPGSMVTFAVALLALLLLLSFL